MRTFENRKYARKMYLRGVGKLAYLCSPTTGAEVLRIGRMKRDAMRVLMREAKAEGKSMTWAEAKLRLEEEGWWCPSAIIKSEGPYPEKEG